MPEPTRTTVGALAPGDHFSLTKSGEVLTITHMERHPRAVWVTYERGRHARGDGYGGRGRIRPNLTKAVWQHHPFAEDAQEADR